MAIFPENGPSVPGFHWVPPSLGSTSGFHLWVPPGFHAGFQDLGTWGSRGKRDLLTLLFRLARALFDKLLHVAHAEANRPAQLDASERRAPPAGSVIPYPVLGHSEQLRRDSGSEVFGTYPPLPDRR